MENGIPMNVVVEPQPDIYYYDEVGILNLQNDYLPKGLVTLESIFTRDGQMEGKEPRDTTRKTQCSGGF
jgi:hypothetical protein